MQKLDELGGLADSDLMMVEYFALGQVLELMVECCMLDTAAEEYSYELRRAKKLDEYLAKACPSQLEVKLDFLLMFAAFLQSEVLQDPSLFADVLLDCCCRHLSFCPRPKFGENPCHCCHLPAIVVASPTQYFDSGSQFRCWIYVLPSTPKNIFVKFLTFHSIHLPKIVQVLVFYSLAAASPSKDHHLACLLILAQHCSLK